MSQASEWRRTFVLIFAGGAFLFGGSEASGQVAWDAPFFTPPTPRAGWGVYLTDPAGGDDIGVMSTFRGSGLLGFRVGIAEARGDGLDVFGGVDLTSPLIRASSDLPVDISWVAGFGISGGDDLLISVPFGVTMGRDLVSDGIRFAPYFTPRVVLDAWFGDEEPDEDLSLDFAFDIGADVAFSEGWAIRFAGTVGDRDAVAIGVNFHR